MTDRRYDAFLAVADEGSFSGAARRLYATQPTVSRQVASLESELGARLFDRAGQVVRLTSAGRIAEGYLRQVCALENRMRSEVAGAQVASREFVLLCPDNMVTYDYEVFWRVVQATSSIMDAKVRVGSTPAAREVGDALRSGRADAALAMSGLCTVGGGDLTSRRLLVRSDTPAYLLCAEGHPLAGCAALSDWRELDGLTVCLPSDDLQNTQHFLDLARESGVCQVRPERVSNTPAMVPIVASGDVVGFSAFPLRDVPGVRCVPLQMYESPQFGLVWLAGRRDLPFERYADEVARIYKTAHPDDRL